MELKLVGRRAIVTGASSGLGAAIATFLAAEGAHVIVHGRNADRANPVVRLIQSAGGQADVAFGDLSTDEGADEAVATAQAIGTIDILVNNAGAYKHLGWMNATSKEWEDAYQTNVVSAVRMIQRLVPPIRNRGWGRVVQIGGGLALQPIAVHAQYSATLAARHNLAVSLARDLKGSGVTSNVVAPGAIRIAAVEQILRHSSSQFGWGETWDEIEQGAVRDLVPNDIGRLGRPEEIAAAVAYLCSGYADYVSGEILRVAGGTIKGVH
jgi:3-oxoacyl-[acyl-carrier protein] reductase